VSKVYPPRFLLPGTDVTFRDIGNLGDLKNISVYGIERTRFNLTIQGEPLRVLLLPSGRSSSSLTQYNLLRLSFDYNVVARVLFFSCVNG
jgi:hypothetical protein